ncbi:MAG TPA: hypothetical protein VKQ34_03955 [Candidatus Saccharimonadales bacterium]|nr:hypothetical protein [Candidatus Saccharimonadales bacterium]
MTYAPEHPTTSHLHSAHPLRGFHGVNIRQTRLKGSEVLRHPNRGLLAIMGACALTDSLPSLIQEASELRELEDRTTGLVTGQRLNTWKPRSKPQDWHGMESTPREVGRAHEIVTHQAKQFANAVMELGYAGHAERYSRAVSFGWVGARNSGDDTLLETVARCYELPVGVKNNLEGDLGEALGRVNRIRSLREGVGGAAVLLYRGGTNALTPHAWEKEYLRALDLTDGQMIVDCAHGSMRAHDPQNGKSVTAQLKARDHVLTLAQAGYSPAGIMMEASDTPSVVDLNMPHAEGLYGVAELAKIKGLVAASADLT